MKRRICVLLALAVCLGLGAPALAAGEVELPDVMDYLASYLADYDPTAEVHLAGQNDNAIGLTVTKASDMDEVLEQTRFALDMMFWYYGFDSMTELEEEPGQTQWETTYSYPDGGVGTVTSFISETECNGWFAVRDAEDYVFVMVGFGDGAVMKSSGTEAGAGAASDADNILPDAWAFFNEEVTHYDTLVTNGRTAYFSLASEDSAAVYAYIDLLQSGRFGLTLTDTWEESFGGSAETVYYVFDCSGTGPDVEITDSLGDRDVSADLTVTVHDWRNLGWCGMSMVFSDALTVADTGDRYTDTGLTDSAAGNPEHSTGPMGSAASDTPSGGGHIHDDDDDEPSSTPFTHEKKCYKCGGDGDVECTQCDGARGKWIYDSVPDYDGDGNTTVRTWQSCSKCHGTGEITCPICDGEGTY